MRGHIMAVETASDQMYLRRVDNEDSTSWVANVALGLSISTDTLYHLKVRVTSSGGTSYYYFKFWPDTSSEPASYTTLGSDTVYISAGKVGYHLAGGASSLRWRADNFRVSPEPSVYATSGDWTSDEISMTDLVYYSYAHLEWDETTPTDTTAAVKARWRTGGTWLACTNGSQIPGIDVGEETAAGSSKDSLELRVELSTTDTSATPVVENLRFYHEPVADAALEVEVGGVGAVVSDGTLEVWGKSQISAGSVITAWDDVWAQSYLPYKLRGLAAAVEVNLNYNGIEIDDIVITTLPDYWMLAGNNLGWYYSMNPVKYASAPVEARWNCQTPWSPIGHQYEWVLIDYSMGMRADAMYLVGHYQLDPHPGSFVLGVSELNPHPGSFILKGYALDPHPGSFLVQGHRLDSHPGSFLVGEENYWSHPGSFIISTEEIGAFPGSYVIYGVNRDGAIFVNIVDSDTHAKLVAEGIVFS